MVNADYKVKMTPENLTKGIGKGAVKALKRASAYIRGVARRKIKIRKHQSSQPGKPPYGHNNVFRQSIIFDVDNASLSAYIGARRLPNKPVNPEGNPVSNIMEKGGRAASADNPVWITKDTPPTNDINGIATYFMARGRGPISWGLTSSQSSGNSKKKKHRGGIMRRYSPVLGKNVYLTYVKIRSIEQAKKVAKTVVDVFGYPKSPPKMIQPRPFMRPSLEDSKPFIKKCFTNFITK